MNLNQATNQMNISEQVIDELMSDCGLDRGADGSDGQFRMLVEGIRAMIGRQSLARNDVGRWSDEKLVAA